MKIQIKHDAGSKTPNEIARYIHCAKCLMEKPDNVSPQEWARLEAGITRNGNIQIWCLRHICNVTSMTIEVKK